MSHNRNGHHWVPTWANQPVRYDSSARLPGHGHDSRLQLPPAFSPSNPWSRSDSVVHRHLQDPQDAHPGPSNSNRYPAPVHHTRQIPINGSDSLAPRQVDQRPQQAFIIQPPAIIPHPPTPGRALRQATRPAMPERTLRQATHPTTPGRTSRQATQDNEDDVLKKLRKVTYNPNLNPNPASLVKSPSLRSKEQNRGDRDHTNTQISKDEDGKGCPVCLEDFEPKETVMVTSCNHMFHKECIVPWLKSRGICPVCRSMICEPRGDASPGFESDGLVGFVAANDLFALELLSVVSALEDSFLFGHPRR